MSAHVFTIRSVSPGDWLAWERMRYALWPGEDENHGEVIHAFFSGKRVEPQHVLLAEIQNNMIGFAELSIRTDLPELPRSRVGYVEGLYVCESMRHRGVARELLNACRAWAVQQGCDAFASDREDRVIIDERYAQLPQRGR